jgi:hypothetical protein
MPGGAWLLHATLEPLRAAQGCQSQPEGHENQGQRSQAEYDQKFRQTEGHHGTSLSEEIADRNIPTSAAKDTRVFGMEQLKGSSIHPIPD